MSTLRISDAPLLPDVDGTEKIPTGGRGDYAVSINQIKTFTQGGLPQQVEDHINDTSNPHQVTKGQVGLGNADNTSDLDKPISTATQEALDLKANTVDVDAALNLKADKNTTYTKTEVDQALDLKADLVGGVIPSEQLPSYVDDVIEVTTDTLPVVGESGKIYVTTDTNRTWRWSGSQYVEISNGGISDSTLKLQTARKIANVDFDGTQDISIPHNNLTDRDVVGSHSATSILSSSGESQQDINDYNGAKWRNKTGGYALNARVMLENGDIVKSTVDGNTNDPNVDMTGWVNFEADQQIFNNKYSKFKQPEAGAVERDLSVRARDVQYGADYATLQNAVDAQRSATSDITLGIKTYTLTAPVNIKGYAYIKGSGFYSDIRFSGSGNGFVYTGTGLQDDHGQRKLSDFQIRGDNTVGGYLGVKNGTTIGYQYTNTGHFSETNGLLVNGHDTGIKIENSYTNRNVYNYYRACKKGLHLKNFTSHREESIYARYNDEAAVLLEGTFQNLTIAGGAIEGNHGRGLWAKNLTAESFPKIVLDDVYFESDGDKAAGVPAIDIQEHPRLHVDVRAGSYWNNVLSGITTGIYKWGSSVSFNGTTLNGFHYATKMRVKDCIDYASYNSDLLPAESIANGLVEPVMMLEYSPNFRVNGLGPIFQVPLSGRPTRKLLVANEATLTYPHVLSKSASTTTTENTSLDYGDGSWTDIGFSASGDYQNNYAQLTNLLDATSEYMSKVFVFLLKPTADCQIGIVSTGAAQTHQAYFQLKAGVTYRMCCFANRAAAGDYRMRLFSTNGAANISYLPIYLAKFKTTQEGINFANMFATGAL